MRTHKVLMMLLFVLLALVVSQVQAYCQCGYRSLIDTTLTIEGSKAVVPRYGDAAHGNSLKFSLVSRYAVQISNLLIAQSIPTSTPMLSTWPRPPPTSGPTSLRPTSYTWMILRRIPTGSVKITQLLRRLLVVHLGKSFPPCHELIRTFSI